MHRSSGKCVLQASSAKQDCSGPSRLVLLGLVSVAWSQSSTAFSVLQDIQFSTFSVLHFRRLALLEQRSLGRLSLAELGEAAALGGGRE